MSGGSFGYLCDRDITDVVIIPFELSRMVEYLEEHHPDHPATKDSRVLFDELQGLYDRFDPVMDALRPVWKAVEWYVSCDLGPDAVDGALRKYTGIDRTHLMSWVPR